MTILTTIPYPILHRPAIRWFLFLRYLFLLRWPLFPRYPIFLRCPPFLRYSLSLYRFLFIQQPSIRYRELPHRAALFTTWLLLLFSATPAQPPVYNSNTAAIPTVYLDFDGELIEGSAWNWQGPIDAASANLESDDILEIFNRVAEDYRIFNLNITTDSQRYAAAPASSRIRIVITPTSGWYGEPAGGVSFVNSFNWGDGTPSWVFSDWLQQHNKYIGEAISHEIGHTLGLQHQSTYDDDCNMVTEYAEGKGEGETGWAPIMGISYYKNLTTWHTGTSVEGCTVIQDDIEVIANGEHHIGLVGDDHGDNLQDATRLPPQPRSFETKGLINNRTDRDVFRLDVQQGGKYKISLVPRSMGANNEGANIDLKLYVLGPHGDTLNAYNPPGLLGATADTSLGPGVYYLVVDGVGNANISDYGSVGHYSLTGSTQTVLPISNLTLKGQRTNGSHLLLWTYEINEPAGELSLECSSDGMRFRTIATALNAKGHTQYRYRPYTPGTLYYRVRILTPPGNFAYYSNTVSLAAENDPTVRVTGTIVRDQITVIANTPSDYQLLDETGSLLGRGKLIAGMNTLHINNAHKGLILLRVFVSGRQQLIRLMKP